MREGMGGGGVVRERVRVRVRERERERERVRGGRRHRKRSEQNSMYSKSFQLQSSSSELCRKMSVTHSAGIITIEKSM